MGDELGGETNIAAIANSLPSHLPSPNGVDSAALVTPLKEQRDDLSPPPANLIQHMDARSRALGRKAELDELRSKRLAKNIRRDFKAGDSVPFSTAEPTSFFLHQKEMEKEWREKQRDSIEFLHSYKNAAVETNPHPPNEKRRVFSSSGYSELDYLFYQKQKASEHDWREKQKMSIEYLHSYRGSGEAHSTVVDNCNVRPAIVTPSGVPLVGKEYMSSIAFDDLRRALEDRLSVAVNCPIPDSPPPSPSDRKVNFDIDKGAHIELCRSDSDASLAHAAGDDEALVTPSGAPLDEKDTMSIALDELQKPREDRLTVTVNCTLPDSPPLSPEVQTMKFEGEEGVYPSSSDAARAGPRDSDILCSICTVGEKPSFLQGHSMNDMQQEDISEEVEDMCPDELDGCDQLVQDRPRSTEKEDDPKAEHDVRQTGLPEDGEETILDHLDGSVSAVEASSVSEPPVGTSDVNSEEPRISLVDACSKDDGESGVCILPVVRHLTIPGEKDTEEDGTVPQRVSFPAVCDLNERIIVSDVTELLIVDKDASGEHDPSTGENAAERMAAREAYASIPATCELCNACTLMTVDTEVDMPIADTFPAMGFDTMLKIEDGGDRFDWQSEVADGTNSACNLCGAKKCEAVSKSSIATPSQSAANKRELQLIAKPQEIPARTPAGDDANMPEAQAGKRQISASSPPRRCAAVKRESQPGEMMPIAEPRSISARSPPRRDTANKRESKIIRPRQPRMNTIDLGVKEDAPRLMRPILSSPESTSDGPMPVRSTNERIAKGDNFGSNEDIPRFMLPILSTPERKTKSPERGSSPKKRVPTYARREIARAGKCTEQWILDLHSTRDGCERCLHFASAKERRKFRQEGHHYRISSTRGGCIRTCPCFPRKEDEMPVRLCRRCFYDTHKLGKL
jgi:hypothetical protein